jgi:hypothetical protein
VGPTRVEIAFDAARPGYQQAPLDVAFLIDATGSMGDEIARLKSVIEIINFQIAHLPTRLDVRFGAVHYRDKRDAYLTRTIPFHGDAELFQESLGSVHAGGGGDNPEDLQSGLELALQGLTWRPEAVKLLFLIADAPPHLDYGQTYTYVDAMRDAARLGIKISTVGASGLNTSGEYVFRQIAQYTMGTFIFLTYGETTESGGGTSTSVCHHTGDNFVTRNLETIVVQIVKRELSHLTDRPFDPGQDYFDAEATSGADSDRVLDELFRQSIRRLIDFSLTRIEPETPTVVLPVVTVDPALETEAERLEDKLTLNLFEFREFKILERANLRQLMEELKLQVSGLFGDARSAELGRLAGAKLMVIAKVHRGTSKPEMYLKLVRVETAEVLSVTLLKVDAALL